MPRAPHERPPDDSERNPKKNHAESRSARDSDVSFFDVEADPGSCGHWRRISGYAGARS